MPLPGEGLVGPHPSFIEVGKPYIFQHQIQTALAAIGMDEVREDSVRLQGVAWIDNVRRALRLPVKTFDTAVIYYHKFRLLHMDTEYDYRDAAAAALFTACKIEDTLKKSREILCAAWNLALAPAEQLSPDDMRFDNHSKRIIVLERIMLESSSFDFRARHPHELVIKLSKSCGFDRDREGRTAYNLSLDMYRTFAPLKQTTPTMAIACVELAARLHNRNTDLVSDGGTGGIIYKKWSTTRAVVMETLLDLLDLYNNHQKHTMIGPQYPIETFIAIRIALNQESAAANLSRYTEWSEVPKPSPAANTNGNHARNGANLPISPETPVTPGTTSPGQAPPSAIGLRGAHGTVRFMLDAARARQEKKDVEAYHKVEEEEYEVEVPIEPERRRGR